jgi:DNA-binding CsgD family transcriptional regulator
MDDKHLFKLYASLTIRQQQVLQLASAGMTNKEIAQRLYIAPSVVAGHLSIIYSELGTLEAFAHIHPNRYTVMLTFAPFFVRHSELRDEALIVSTT